MTNREEEVAIDLDDDNFDGEMIIEEDSTTRVKQAASKRKGRGFNNSQRGEKRDHFKDGSFDRLEDSTGKAQRSVEGWIVLVTNVHEELTEEDLIEKFAEYGPIKNIHMNLDRRTGYVKGYALIEYNEYEEAKNAISNLDGTDLQGKILKCDFAFVRVTIGISALEYKQRQLALSLSVPKKSLIIVPGFGLRYQTNGIFYPFHQQTEAGLEGAKEVFGADHAYPISSIELHLHDLLKSKKIDTIFTNLPLNQANEPSLLDGTHINTVSGSATHPSGNVEASDFLSKLRIKKEYGGFGGWLSPNRVKVKPLGTIIDSLRNIKSSSEINLMRNSGRIAGRAFQAAMRATKPGMTEHQIHATLEYEVKMQMGTGLSYVPVVASGKNALILHYVQNLQQLKDGDLLLVDAGAEYGGYASDITRTWPVNGKFSPAQREVYTAVLKVQKEMIKKSVINATLDGLQYETYEMLKEELSRILKRTIGSREMNTLYPHHVGHYIGLDVHDTASISRSKPLEEGMCITIEPGIYIPDTDEYGIYRGIGIRIEDDICITKDGPVILTVEAPKEIEDIEFTMNN